MVSYQSIDYCYVTYKYKILQYLVFKHKHDLIFQITLNTQDYQCYLNIPVSNLSIQSYYTDKT